MRITIIAVFALLVVGLGAGPSRSQTIRAQLPAEIPPPSYTGRQYVDSKGCVYIRAGVAGNVTWVPRVDRNRRQICGYQPSLSAAGLAQARPPTVADSPAPEILTLGPQDRPVRTRQSAPAEPAAAAPVAVATARPEPATAPVAVRPAPVRAAETRPAAATVTSATLPTERTRVVPRHVFDDRQNTRSVSVPRGYRPVWTDDRLNPHRAERTLAPSLAAATPVVPRGFRAAWGDERLSLRRAQGSPAGEAASDAIWSRTVPRPLLPVATQGQIVVASNNARQGNSPYWVPPVARPQPVARLSTRSEAQAAPLLPALQAKPAYIRVATFAAASDARRAAEALARSGLTMRLGATAGGVSVVLAGPYKTSEAAGNALARLRQAGYGGAVLMR